MAPGGDPKRKGSTSAVVSGQLDRSGSDAVRSEGGAGAGHEPYGTVTQVARKDLTCGCKCYGFWRGRDNHIYTYTATGL